MMEGASDHSRLGSPASWPKTPEELRAKVADLDAQISQVSSLGQAFELGTEMANLINHCENLERATPNPHITLKTAAALPAEVGKVKQEFEKLKTSMHRIQGNLENRMHQLILSEKSQKIVELARISAPPPSEAETPPPPPSELSEIPPPPSEELSEIPPPPHSEAEIPPLPLSEELSINDLLVRFEALHEATKTKEKTPVIPMVAFRDLMGRFTGSGTRGYTINDFDTVSKLQTACAALSVSPGIDAESTITLQAFQDLLKDIQESLKQAFERQLNVIKGQKDLTGMLAEMQNGFHPDTQSQGFQFACYDLYWDLLCPLEACFSIKDFRELCKRPPALLKDVIAENSTQIEQIKKLDRSFEEILLKYAESTAVINAHALAYLQGVRKKNAETWGEHAPPRVLIFGAGPGGLMRALAISLMGIPVKLFEKEGEVRRDRWQEVHIRETSLLRYIGIIPKLPSQQGDIVVPITTLQSTLKKRLEELLGQKVVEERFEAVDLTVGQDVTEVAAQNKKGVMQSKQPVRAGCLVTPIEIEITTTGERREKRGTAQWEPADLVIDATGAHAAISKILGNPRKPLTKGFMMVGARFETDKTALLKPRLPPEDKDMADWVITSQRTSQGMSFYIQPGKRVQDELLKLQAKKREKQQRLGAFVSLDDSQDSQAARKQSEEARKQLEEECQSAIDELDKFAQHVAIDGARAVARDALKKGEVIQEESAEVSPFRVEVAEHQPAIMVHTSIAIQTGDALISGDPETGISIDINFEQAHASIKLLADFKNPHSTPFKRYRHYVFTAGDVRKQILEKSVQERPGQPELYETLGFEHHQLKKLNLFSDEQLKILSTLAERAAGPKLHEASDEEKRTLNKIREIFNNHLQKFKSIPKELAKLSSRLEELSAWFNADQEPPPPPPREAPPPPPPPDEDS